MASDAIPDERRSNRVRSWRRRVLQRRGALRHAAMARDSENTSLAMLDENGVVVSWYGQVGAASEGVVDRHVAQFYLPEEVADDQPLHDLCAAVIGGGATRQGWRRQTDGTPFWGHVVIEPVVLRNGRLQGFSYLIRPASRAETVQAPARAAGREPGQPWTRCAEGPP
jgi:hypothetical protein